MTTRPAIVVLLAALSPGAAALAQSADEEAVLVVQVSSDGEVGGATRVGPIREGRLRRGQRRTYDYALEAGRCYVAIGRGGAGVANIDVLLSRGSAPLARDSETAASARARWCAGERAERVRLKVSAFRGAGRFAAALFLEPEGAAASASAEPGPEGVSALARLQSLVEQRAPGARAVTPATREELREGQSLERPLPLTPGRCYRVLATGEAAIADLDLELLGPSGASLGRDGVDGGVATLGVLAPLCPAAPGEHRLRLVVERGEGAFAWQVLASDPGGAGAATPVAAATTHRVGGSTTSFVAQRIRHRHRESGEGRAPTADLVSGTLRTGARAQHRFAVRAGQCYVVLAAAVPSMHDLDLALRDPYGNELAADATVTSAPAVRACANANGEWIAETYAFDGYGAYGLQVFAGPR